MKILVSYSGGKDSEACLIYSVKKYGSDKVIAVFCDTGWEHPETYKHIEKTCKSLGVELVVLKSKFDFVSLAEYKKRFPSTKARFCTSELKIKPMIDYILSLNESCIIIQGIRAKESASRAKMNAECMFFKSYFQPYANGKKETYRKKDVIAWCKKYDASILRPIFDWTAQEVIDYILESGFKPNKLYSMGFSRVGCFPCIMCRQSEFLLIHKYEKEMLERLQEAESKIGRSFFPPNYIPKRYCENKKFPMLADVIRYVTNKNATIDMYEPKDGYSCMSLFHGICE